MYRVLRNFPTIPGGYAISFGAGRRPGASLQSSLRTITFPAFLPAIETACFHLYPRPEGLSFTAYWIKSPSFEKPVN